MIVKPNPPFNPEGLIRAQATEVSRLQQQINNLALAQMKQQDIDKDNLRSWENQRSINHSNCIVHNALLHTSFDCPS
jgi:hypothetical protein